MSREKPVSPLDKVVVTFFPGDEKSLIFQERAKGAKAFI